MRRILRIAAWLVAWVAATLLVVVLAAAASVPWWLPKLAQHFASPLGIDITELNLSYPGTHGLHIEALALRSGTTTLRARDIDVGYSLRLRENGHVERVVIGQLQATTPAANIDAMRVDAAYSMTTVRKQQLERLSIAQLRITVLPTPPRKEPSKLPQTPDALWQLMPVREAHIAAFHIGGQIDGQIDGQMAGTQPEFAVSGSVDFDQQQIVARLQATKPTIAANATAIIALTRAGHLTIQLGRTPASANASASASASAHANIDATLDASGTQLAVNINAAMPDDLLSLASATAGIATRAGSLTAHAHATLVWPLPVVLDQAALLQLAKSTTAEGSFALQWQGDVPERIAAASISARGSIAAQGGSVAVQLAPGSMLAGQLIMAAPLQLFGQSIAKSVTLGATRALSIKLDHEALRVIGAARLTMGNPGATLIADIDALQMPVTPVHNAPSSDKGSDKASDKGSRSAGSQPGSKRGDAGGALGDGLTSHLLWQADLARTSFARFISSGNATITLVGNVATLHIAPHATLGFATLGDWSHGVTTATNANEFAVQVDARTLGYRGNNITFALQLPRATFGASNVLFDATTLTVAHLNGSVGGRITTDGALVTHVTSGKYQLPLSIAGTISLEHDVTQLALTLSPTKSSIHVPFNVTHNLTNGRGNLHIDTTINSATALGAALFDRWREEFDLDRGKVQLLANLNWRIGRTATQLDGAGHVATIDAQAHYADYLMRGANISADWRLTNDGWSANNGTARIAEAFVGTPVTAISAAFAYANGALASPGLSLEVVGGHARTGPLQYAVKSGAAEFDVHVDGLALDKLLALEGGDIDGSGILDGKLPMSLVNNVPTIHDGAIAARAPGGRIAYAAVSSIAEYARGPGLDFAFNALKDFRFDTLTADVQYAADSNMKLAVRLYGRNPEVEKGRTIHYNLTVTENVADLLRSLRASTDVSDRFAKQLSQ